MSDKITREEIYTLRREIERQRDELTKLRRSLEDILMNLDTENMPAVTDLIETYRAEASNSVAEVAAEADEAMARIGLVVEHTSHGNEVRAAVIVRAINDASDVTISADKINLNGAVSANDNFKINLDGSVECKDVTISGGEIHIPTPLANNTPVMSVFSTDGTSSVGLYADRVNFSGASSGTAEYSSESALDNRRLSLRLKQALAQSRVLDYGSISTAKTIRVAVTELDENGDEVEGSSLSATAEFTPYAMRHTYIAAHPISSGAAAGMMPLYIDRYGNIYAGEV